MWARHMEVALACWLAASPFVFRRADAGAELLAFDLGLALAIATLALSCYAPKLRRAHFLLLPIAAWLSIEGWIEARTSGDPAAQNHLIVGLTLAMFALVPSDASRPPRSWREEGRASERRAG
jgi:hypothetical protein